MQNNVVAQALQMFNTCLADIELPPLDDFVLDGEIHRFGPGQKGWYALEDDGHAIFGTYGNWSEKEDGITWPYFELQYSNGEDKETARQRRETSIRAKQERQCLAHEQARDMAEAEYSSAVEVEAYPYLTNKKIGLRLRGLRMNTKNELLVPFRSTDGIQHTRHSETTRNPRQNGELLSLKNNQF